MTVARRKEKRIHNPAGRRIEDERVRLELADVKARVHNLEKVMLPTMAQALSVLSVGRLTAEVETLRQKIVGLSPAPASEKR